ncbi:glycosyltransferase family 4 protein [Maribacter sp. 2-571]|uniref:glycosyltransferase family 4 protein n=1 Tax=Maribacter sp. 2-571 TaxID=3417569 RepID=UPI003D3256CC
MKVLWVTNIVFPEVATKLGCPSPVVGAWMYVLAKDLSDSGISLTVVAARTNMPDFHYDSGKLSYYLIHSKRKITELDKQLKLKWEAVIKAVKPDIVHIHGTEYAYGLCLMHYFPQLRYIISIQGVLNVIAENYAGGIDAGTIKRNLTIRDLIQRDGISKGKRAYMKWAKTIEDRYFSLATDVIGRTQFDFEYIQSRQKKINYHFCNESLRDGFYDSNKWNLEDVNTHSIFISQAVNPIKGLHMVLGAVDLLKKEFPNIRIKVGGRNILRDSSTLYDKVKRSGYGKIIKSLIRRFSLQDTIFFLGELDEKQMISEYLKCHVFVCPSIIENSPNSLGEAQILGVPCVATAVGGIPSMVIHEKTGLLYNFEDIKALAENLKKLFNDNSLALSISKESKKVAAKRHDRLANSNRTIEIYNRLLQQNSDIG